MRRALLLLSLPVLLVYAAHSSSSRTSHQARVESPAPPSFVTNLASFDFDDGMGGPDPQGWVSVDVSAQRDTFSHVDDFVGLPPQWSPNEGAKSYWIGTRGEDPEFCHWVNPPGYGNLWNEHLESVDFPVSGDVTLSYKLSYDTEEGYDFLDVDYLSKSNRWNELVEYCGPTFGPQQGHIVGTHTIPADSLDGSARFRVTFESDGCCSDEDGAYPNLDTDGAALIDSITVADATGIVDYEDWENSPLGATQSSDGDWFSGSSAYFGDYAGLFDGTTVVQEDSATMNSTYIWGFFNGSPDTYACGGFPGQASIPLLPISGYASPTTHIRNGITSPLIDLRKDLNGDPVPGPPDHVAIGYDVYVDQIAGNSVYYDAEVRYRFECGSMTPWIPLRPTNVGPQKAWHREETVTRVRSGLTHVQVRLVAADFGDEGVHTCHSHAPLFDNVTVDGWFDDVTGIRPQASEYVLHENTPNPFNPSTRITYDVPRGGGIVRLSVFSVSGRRIATLFAGYRPEGSYVTQWDGRNDRGEVVGSGVYFCRLDAPGFTASRKMVLLK